MRQVAHHGPWSGAGAPSTAPCARRPAPAAQLALHPPCPAQNWAAGARNRRETLVADPCDNAWRVAHKVVAAGEAREFVVSAEPPHQNPRPPRCMPSGATHPGEHDAWPKIPQPPGQARTCRHTSSRPPNASAEGGVPSRTQPCRAIALVGESPAGQHPPPWPAQVSAARKTARPRPPARRPSVGGFHGGGGVRGRVRVAHLLVPRLNKSGVRGPRPRRGPGAGPLAF